jgi:hypothetical protein
MIPSSSVLDQSVLTTLLTVDPLVQQYRTFFALLDWSFLDRGPDARSSRGRPAHPESAYLKAFFIRQHQQFSYTSQLRRFLVQHPLLIIELGFHLTLDPSAPYGFDIEHTLPTRFWFSHKLRCFDPDVLQEFLRATVTALQAEIPGLGEVVAFDVKHIFAWVKENNDNAYVPDRYDKTRQLVGDPDCRLGVKKRTNLASSSPVSSSQTAPADPAAPTNPSNKKGKKRLIWGYGTGVAAATVPGYGDVVLAEYTQPFNVNDVTYFRPLYQRTVAALAHFPTHLTADAAYDAWYVYQAAALHGGIAAVPCNQHGHPTFTRDPDGVPRCPKGLRMHPTYPFAHPNGYRAQLYRCPLLFPTPQAHATCDHQQFQVAKGCVKHINIEVGGLMRVTLDRNSPLYHALYTQRTCAERINSQAKELGIERPKVRNKHSVAHLNTLTYIVINAKVLLEAKTTNRGLLQMN